MSSFYLLINKCYELSATKTRVGPSLQNYFYFKSIYQIIIVNITPAVKFLDTIYDFRTGCFYYLAILHVPDDKHNEVVLHTVQINTCNFLTGDILTIYLLYYSLSGCCNQTIHNGLFLEPIHNLQSWKHIFCEDSKVLLDMNLILSVNIRTI